LSLRPNARYHGTDSDKFNNPFEKRQRRKAAQHRELKSSYDDGKGSCGSGDDGQVPVLPFAVIRLLVGVSIPLFDLPLTDKEYISKTPPCAQIF
jgi:hypothetical protein